MASIRFLIVSAGPLFQRVQNGPRCRVHVRNVRDSLHFAAIGVHVAEDVKFRACLLDQLRNTFGARVPAAARSVENSIWRFVREHDVHAGRNRFRIRRVRQPENGDRRTGNSRAHAAIQKQHGSEERLPVLQRTVRDGVRELVIAQREQLEFVRQLVKPHRKLFRAVAVVGKVAGVQKNVGRRKLREPRVLSVRIGKREDPKRYFRPPDRSSCSMLRMIGS